MKMLTPEDRGRIKILSADNHHRSFSGSFEKALASGQITLLCVDG